MLIGDISKRNSKEMLLSATDFQDTWKEIRTRTWRTGTHKPYSEPFNRAKDSNSFTAWRLFGASPSARSMWIEVIPLASESDTPLALSDLDRRLKKNPRSRAKILDEQIFRDLKLTNATFPWAFEQHTRGKNGDVLLRIVASGVKNVIFFIALVDEGTSWNWDEVESVARLQKEKIENHFN